jgi:hypothetical protein
MEPVMTGKVALVQLQRISGYHHTPCIAVKTICRMTVVNVLGRSHLLEFEPERRLIRQPTD